SKVVLSKDFDVEYRFLAEP
ncbi:DUF2627 domain-containing protein, partial [Erwinia amylovora]